MKKFFSVLLEIVVGIKMLGVGIYIILWYWLRTDSKVSLPYLGVGGLL
jgi:hypothetical protein